MQAFADPPGGIQLEFVNVPTEGQAVPTHSTHFPVEHWYVFPSGSPPWGGADGVGVGFPLPLHVLVVK